MFILEEKPVCRQVLISRLDSYKPQHCFSIEMGSFIIKTAQSGEDLRQALKLRHDIFLVEELKKSYPDGFDIEFWDFHADHILVFDQKQNLLVGTYRLMCSDYIKEFYSESEFDLSEFKNYDSSIKLELGRSCVKKEYRTGTFIGLLWKGIAHYSKQCQARYLMGCTSVKSEELWVAKALYLYFKSKELILETYNVFPKKDFIVPHFDQLVVTDEQIQNAKDYIPAILHSYFHAGARCLGAPAWDRDFQCMDFFTVLDLTQMTNRFKKRYLEATIE